MAKANTKKKITKKAPAKKAKKVAPKKKTVKAKRAQPKAKPAVKKAKKKVVLRKPSVKKTVKKTAKKVVKKPVVKKTVSKKKVSLKKAPVKGKSKSISAKKVVKQIVKKVKHLKPVVAARKSNTEIKKGKNLKSVPVKTGSKPVKDRNEFDRKMEQKAQRIMKELEERMDISKVKPRISVPLPAPKPKPAPVVIKLPEPTNTNKEKFQMEFEFRSSRSILFYYLSDSSGLAGWFADDVNEHEGRFTFTWEGSTQVAKLVAVQDNTLIRFQWETDTDGTYFQFEIKEDDITGDIALVITDWINPGERDSNAKLWESQVLNLKQLIGS